MTCSHSPDRFIEVLEPRRLMSVFVRNQTLHIVGTTGDDSFKFFRHNDKQLRFSLNAKLFRINRERIQSMEIDGGAGNDLITVATNNIFNIVVYAPCIGEGCPTFAIQGKAIAIAGSIRGGPGDDTIVGGMGGWSISGGDGDDVISGWINSGTTISGGPGDDTLSGGMFHDHLSGGDGNDLLIGGDGDDTLDGGDGFDTLRGGNGHNTINPGPQPAPPVVLLPQSSLR